MRDKLAVKSKPLMPLTASATKVSNEVYCSCQFGTGMIGAIVSPTG